MRFVLEHHAARKSVDSYGSDDITTQVESETHEIVDEEYIEEYTEQDTQDRDDDVTIYEVEEGGLLNLVSETPRNVTPSNTPKQQKRKKNDQSEMLQHVAGAMSTLSNAIAQKQIQKKQTLTSKYTAFANFVEAKLSQMSADLADEVEEEITKLLFKGVKRSKQ
uniref:Uncharacterized protein n=2 Tax=Photinus pyralis TaxID=7054 RepID=A0A1Y1LEA9_PHOPY